MPIPNTYPVFEADQVLTNQHLNNLFNYLDQQERLTRNKLIGSGIVCGLEITNANGTIEISKGCGLTSQGFLILLCETVYTYYIPYTRPALPDDLEFVTQCNTEIDRNHIPFFASSNGDNGNGLFQLITDETYNGLDDTGKASAIQIAQANDLPNYIVVLFLEADELALKNCDTNDCNDKGSRMDLEVKALLVDKSLLTPNGTNGDTNKLLHYTQLRRYNVPVKTLSTADDVLNGFINLTDDATIDSLADDLNYCYIQYQHLLDSFTSNPFVSLSADLKIWRQFIIKRFPFLIQYFYDLLDDLIKAFNEFIQKITDVMSECCGDEMQFPFHLMLGEATLNSGNQAASSYRQYFIYSPLFDPQNEGLYAIRSLFARIVLMYRNFQITEQAFKEKKMPLGREIKITPSRYGATPLSHRCIPYYYQPVQDQKKLATDIAGDLYVFWDYVKTKKGRAAFNLSYNANQYTTADQVINPLNYDIEAFDFYRVEGHIGQQVDDVLLDVTTIQQQNNLPFQAVALSADYLGALLKGDDPICIIQDLESDYRILLATFVCILHDAFCYAGSIPYQPPPVILAATGQAKAKAARTRKAATAVAEEAPKPLLSDINISIQVVRHPFISALVNEYQTLKVYNKSDFLSRLCSPANNTIGSMYISILSKGAFVNPEQINPDVPASFFYHHFFELIDSIENMFLLLMPQALSGLDIDAFQNAYDRYASEVNTISNAVRTQIKPVTPGSAINPLPNRLTDIFVTNVYALLRTCIIEQLEALITEYKRRLAQYNLARNFGYYFKNHGGVEHKAGVPKGGTFLIVYHEERRNQFVNVNSLFINKELGSLMLTRFYDLVRPDVSSDVLTNSTSLLQTAIQYQDPELYARFRDVLTQYLDACKDLPDDKRKDLTVIINDVPKLLRFDLRDGMVIADFYIPYLCCSDCPPIAYILPQAALKLDVSDPVCDDANKNYSVKLTASGGTPPYTYFVNNTQQQNENIVLPNDSPDTPVSVKDAVGSTATGVVKSHICCNLPCDGKAMRCRYTLWVARPDPNTRIPHKIIKASINFTDADGTVSSPDVLKIFKDVFAGQHNIIINNNYDQIFGELAKNLNLIVPAQFMANGQPFFTYDPQSQTLGIELFECQHVSMVVDLQVIRNDKTINLEITYDDTTGVTIEDQTNQIKVVIPEFDCVQMNKCTGQSENLCKQALSIDEIKGEQEEFGKSFFKFSATPAFDKYYWYFHNCIPTYSDQPTPEHVEIPQGVTPLVRLVGIQSATGCFAVLEKVPTIINIIG